MNRIRLLSILTISAMLLSAAGMTFLASAQSSTGQTGTTASKATPTPTPPKITEEDEVIRVETELVNLNVRVIDRNNRPVNGVPQNEFKVYEDNVLQDIEFFSVSEVPTQYGLVIDNSGSLRQQLDKVIEASKILVATNKPVDETIVIRFVSRDKISIEQNFTPNKQYLNDALENLYIEGGQTAIIDAIYLAAERVAEYNKDKDKDDRRRRALIIVTDGEDRDSYYTEPQLFEMLRETDVQIYTIGFINDLSKDSGLISKSPQGKARAFLQKLATETGGKAYFPATSAELPGLAKEIASELRTQYSIGYIPTNDRKDGTFRNIRVQVDDGPSRQKRIAITKAGRMAEAETPAPTKPGTSNR